MSLQPAQPSSAKEIAAQQALKRAAIRIQEDPDLRLWRDEYLTGMQNRMAVEVVDLVLAAKTFDDMAAAKGMAIARGKIGDMQAAMVSMAQQNS